MKIKYTQELMGIMSLFSRITGAGLKDCFEEDGMLYFVVENGEIAKAIGKGGVVIRKLQETFKRKLKIIEFNADVTGFVRNAVYPVRVDSIENEDGVIVIRSNDREAKGLIIGRNAKNLNTLKNVVGRYFTVDDIRVE